MAGVSIRNAGEPARTFEDKAIEATSGPCFSLVGYLLCRTDAVLGARAVAHLEKLISEVTAGLTTGGALVPHHDEPEPSRGAQNPGRPPSMKKIMSITFARVYLCVVAAPLAKSYVGTRCASMISAFSS